MSIKYELDTSFRWYLNNSNDGNPKEAVRKKHANKVQSEDISFDLYTMSTRLLPFQFYIPVSERTINNNTFVVDKWYIVPSVYDNPFAATDYIDVLQELTNAGRSLNDYLFKTAIANVGVYYIGCAKEIDFPFSIGKGYWYCAIKLKDGTVIVSEDFNVPCESNDDNTFFNNTPGITRIDWWHSTDILDILYQFNAGSFQFKNRLYLRTDPVPNTPNVIEEGVNDAFGTFIPTTVKIVDTYSLKDYVPDHIFRALQCARAHDNIFVWPNAYQYLGKVRIRDCKMDWSENNIDGIVTLELEQLDRQKMKGLCNMNAQVGSPIAISAANDFVKLYPKVGSIPANKFTVIDNDSGLGLYVDPIVNFRPSGATINLNLLTDGRISIPSLPSVGGFTGNTVHVMPYTLRDGFGGVSYAHVGYIIQDWTPNADFYELPAIELWGGKTQWTSVGSYVWNLFANDYPPLNADNIECIPGSYFAASGSGNYLVVTADGYWTLFIVNPSGIMYYEDFLIQYKNNSLSGAIKSQWATFSWVI